MSSADKETEKRLKEMEKHLREIYDRATSDVGKAWTEYMEKANAEVSRLTEAYIKSKESGDQTAIREAGKALAGAKQERTIYNNHYQQLTRDLAENISHVNETATAYINNQLPEIYSLNYNEVAKGVNKQLGGMVGGTSFDLVDQNTVKRLATRKENLLPLKEVNGKKDIRWNVAKINSEVTQGILQGESMPKIATRLSDVLGMDATSAIRNARTTVTSAQNKGRMDMMRHARSKGVILQKGWSAARDNRVRHSHEMVDGEFVDEDEPFSNGLMFPGDPNGEPEEVYNCRCSLIYKVVGFGEPQEEEDDPWEGFEEETKEDEKNPTQEDYPTIAGVTRGEPMTHDEADSGKVNPNFDQGGGYRINCQSCVGTYEARLRGYDVEVVPNDSAHSMCSKLARDQRLMWLNKDGTQAELTIGNGVWTYAGKWEDVIPNAKRFEQKLLDTLEEGGRYTLGFKWRGFNSGHIVTIHKESGVLAIYDPQCNRSISGKAVSQYLDRIQYQRQYKGYKYYQWPDVLRIDDKDINFSVANEIMKKVGG